MVSVVVPIYNEQENLPELRRRMSAALDGTGLPWELILVNDGSRDRSAELMRQFHAEDGRIKAVMLSRNFGHQPAVTAGIHHARGDCVVLIDGDLQDPPEVIPAMIEQWRAGNQVVLGERRTRGDVRGLRGLGLNLFYPILQRVDDLPHGPDAGIFGLMDRVVVDHFNQLPERNRFIPGLRTWLGFRTASVPYDRNDRAAGKPKQTLSRLLKYAMDGMISFSYKPLRWVTYFGFFVSLCAFLLIPTYVLLAILYPNQVGRGFFTIIICVLFLGGVQLISIGILGEYVGRIYEESKQRPLYVVAERLGVDAASPAS